jgi:DNA-binding protein HU-beta
MTKEDLVAKAANAAGISKTQAAKALKAIISGIEVSLKKGDKVTLVGFGTFSVVKRAARQGRNPATGKPIHIPAAKIPKFRPGKKLRKAV